MTAWTGSMRFIESLGRSISQVPAVPSPEASPDAEVQRLVAGVKRGDEAAFQDLYNRYQERLFRFGLVLAHGDESMAGEMVQSVFIIAAGKLRTVENEQHLWNWLALVGRQQLNKMLKRRKKDTAILTMAALPECSHADADVEKKLEEVLDAALAELTPDDRQVVEWFYFDGLSHQQIAERTNGTAKAISSRLERTRVFLRTRVQRALSCEH